MTPDQFATSAKDWISAIESLVIPLTSLAVSVFGLVAFIRQKAIKERLNDHAVAINELSPAANPQQTETK